MAFIDTWIGELSASLIVFESLISDVEGLDTTYAVYAAALLWPLRKTGTPTDQSDALLRILGDESQVNLVMTLVRSAADPSALARDVAENARSNPQLASALDKLLAYFWRFFPRLHSIDIVDSYLFGGIVNVGGQMTIEGDVVLSPPRMLCPPPPEAPRLFGGRDEMLRDLCDELKRSPQGAVIAICGIGGIGKTTLARQLANLLHSDNTFQAVLWADVSRVPAPLQILEAWASYADPRYSPPDLPLKQIALGVKALLKLAIDKACIQCEPERVLVVLDDVWDDANGTGKEAVQLLQTACPNESTILVTTRSENLAIDLHSKLQALVQLNLEQGMNLLMKYEYLAKEPTELLQSLVRALGGHPLALDLAARRIQKSEDKANALVQHTHLYQQELPLGGYFDKLRLDQGEQREDNLTKVLAYSYEDLSTEDQQRFRALGILAYDAPFHRSLLAVIWQVDLDLVEDYCGRLRLLSLLELDPLNGTGWYRQHTLLRAYSRALLNDSNEVDLVLSYYTKYIVDITALFLHFPPERWATLIPYLPHIYLIGDSLVSRYNKDSLSLEQSKLALQFALQMAHFLAIRPSFSHDLDWLNMGLKASRVLQNQNAESFFYNVIGETYSIGGQKDDALKFYARALALSTTINDQIGQSETLTNIAEAYMANGNIKLALSFCQRAIAIYDNRRAPQHYAKTLNTLGWIYARLGNTVSAWRCYREALKGYRKVADARGKATVLNNLGQLFVSLRKPRAGLICYNQALPIRKKIGDYRGESITLNNLGEVYMQLNEPHQALNYFEQALAMRVKIGDPRATAVALNNIGTVFATLPDNLSLAESYMVRALAMHRTVVDPYGEAITLTDLGSVYYEMNNMSRAGEVLTQAISLHQRAQNRRGEATARKTLGLVLVNEGKQTEAHVQLLQALTLFQELGEHNEQGIINFVIGSVLVESNQLLKATESFKQALASFDEKTYPDNCAQVHDALGTIYYHIGNLISARHHLDDALRLYVTIGISRESQQAALLKKLGILYYEHDEPEKGIDFLERCVTLEEQISSPNLADDRAVLEQMRNHR